jgi:flagellar biosynthesis protein FlhF
MQIKRYTAPDMRQALRLVRDEQGPDAVILSSRKLDGRVEVTIAIDPEEVEAAVAMAEAAPARGFEALLATQPPAPAAEPAAAVPAAATPMTAPAPARNDDALNEELRSLRRMLEKQLAALAWNDLTRREPVAAELLRELTEFGFSRELSAQVVDGVGAGLDYTRARRLAIARLADRVAVLGDRWTEYGGRVALVGPSGCGKTTAIARLAARWVMRHGPSQVALVCADEQRLGAREELARIGRLLGVATFAVDSLEQLPGLLARLEDRRLVLVDTAGRGPRDAGLDSQVAALRAVPGGLETALVLAATTQAGAIEETVARYATAAPTACILTRTDECASLGGALSALISAGLPVAYVSDGPRIPDDLRPARALDLVCLAVQLAERSGAAADEDMLSRRFGGRSDAA